ncbi:DegQ family serine endoprotease [Emcibacter sp. SYSU 3D8]|uniref:DegQ family serine endoprotease n=1 Tax=Emcibacter sp. SYSU 3D8 TaxID=3133969 RepID=UPI0031FE74F6
MKRFMIGVAAVVVAGALAWAYVPQVRTLFHDGTPSRPPLVLAEPGSTPPAMPSLHPVLTRVSGAVVNVSVEGSRPGAMNPLLEDPFFRRFFGAPEAVPEQKSNSVGSGVIIDAANGYILTNRHVIADADRVEVTLTDRRELEAKLVGADAEMDIAVLKVDAADLVAMPVGDSSALKTGDFVVAMGNPFGLGQTATLGIVSALGRSGLGIEGYEDFIQTDASINPGNSGGALVDQSGNLIGINTAILSRSGGNIGIGFAIPVNMAMRAARQIIEHGSVERGQIGVSIQDITPELADAMQIKPWSGALVANVMRGTPAEQAGLRAGDVIAEVNGHDISSGTELRNRVGLMRPGEEVKLQVQRNGKVMKVSLKLAAREQAADASALGNRFAGLGITPIPEGHPLSRETTGLYVQSVAPGSKAARAGIREGDIIVEVDRRPVATPDDLRQAETAAAGRPMLVHIVRGAGSLFLAMP